MVTYKNCGLGQEGRRFRGREILYLKGNELHVVGVGGGVSLFPLDVA